MSGYVQMDLFPAVVTGVFTVIYTDGSHVVFTTPLTAQAVFWLKAQASANPQLTVEDLSADGCVYIHQEGLVNPMGDEEIPF